MVDEVYGSAPVDWFVRRLVNLLTFILAIVYCSAIFWVDLGPLICQGYKLVGGQEGQRWRKKQVRHR